MSYLAVIEVENGKTKSYISRLKQYQLIATPKDGKVTQALAKEILFRDEEEVWNTYSKVVDNKEIVGHVRIKRIKVK